MQVPTNIYQTPLAAVVGLAFVAATIVCQENPMSTEDQLKKIANSHAQTNMGWKKEEFHVMIRPAPDNEGNHVVNLIFLDDRNNPRPGGGRSVQLIIDSKTFKLVRELKFQ